MFYSLASRYCSAGSVRGQRLLRFRFHSELRFLSRRFICWFRTLLRLHIYSAIPKSELLQKRSELPGTWDQGTGVLRPGSLVSTEQWPWLRSRGYIVWAHWQWGSLDFSLWISPLLGEIPPLPVLLVVYALWISPLLAFVIV
jgi:hypothetical protein